MQMREATLRLDRKIRLPHLHLRGGTQNKHGAESSVEVQSTVEVPMPTATGHVGSTASTSLNGLPLESIEQTRPREPIFVAISFWLCSHDLLSRRDGENIISEFGLGQAA